MLLMNKLKSKGANCDPWGTPDVKMTEFEQKFLIFIVYFLLNK